jgi:hypothetical protein
MLNLLSILLLSNIINAATTTGTTAGCPERAELIANEGDKFVTIRMNGKDHRLNSTSGKPFGLQSKDPVTFRSDDKNHKLGEPSLEFEMTSVVMSSLPRLNVSYSGVQNKCRVDLHVDKK